jgi:hypothetical protein
MEYTIELLAAEIDSLKYEYKRESNPEKRTEYSIRIVEHKRALKILKQANCVQQSEVTAIPDVSIAKRKVCRCYEVPPKKDYEKCDTCGKPYEYVRQT